MGMEQNFKLAVKSLMSSKARAILTMLGIIIGIGSVISIVSIGDTMRGLFADLYKDVVMLVTRKNNNRTHI